MDSRAYDNTARFSATIPSSRSLSLASSSAKATANSAVARGSNNGSLPPSSADFPAIGNCGGPLADDGGGVHRNYAASRVLFPKSTTAAMWPMLMALSPAEADRASDASSRYNQYSSHTSPSTDAALPQPHGGSPLHLLRCSGDQEGPARCDSGGGSGLGQGVRADSPSLVFPLPVVPQTQLSLLPSQLRPTAEEARSNWGHACQASLSPRSISGNERVDSGTPSPQQPLPPQRMKTSYAVHRVLPRMAHPQFTNNPHILFPQHGTSKSGSSTHTSQPCSPPLPPLSNTVDVAAVPCEPSMAAATMDLHPMREKVNGNGVTSPPLSQKIHRSLLHQTASLSTLDFVALPSRAQMPAELTEAESPTQPPEALSAKPDFVFDCAARAPVATIPLLLPASAADIAVVPSTSTSCSSQLEEGSGPLLGVAMQQRKPHTLLASALAFANLHNGEDKRNVSGAFTPCLMAVLSPLNQQPRHHQHNQPSAVALSKAATPVMSGGYGTRDFQRGTWVFLLARQERLARELLEAEETSEALRCLPASYAAWRTYYRHTLGSAECGAVHLTSSTDMGMSLSSGVSTALTAQFAPSTMMLSDTGDADASCEATDSASLSHCRLADKAEGKQKGKKPLTLPPHPAFAVAAYRLELLESILGDEIRTEEDEAFHVCLEKPFKYEHRLLTVGTLPLERFLRSWIASHRARRLRRALQRSKVWDLEQEARAALHATSKTLQRRFQLMVTALVEQEHYYRRALELLYAQDAAWTGVVLLRLQEQVECFPLAFGAVMSRARVCGRMKGATLFSNLALAEQAIRETISGEEARHRAAFPTELEMRGVSRMQEPQARKKLVDREAAERAVVHQVVCALQTHYSLREVDIEEGIERQHWLKQPMQNRVDSVVASATPPPLRRDVVASEVEL
ncbi:hypothetical protein conserved [Leishmania donovani]|uniref:Hypothetical_protein_conserved n=1 Tax=Leishmania donovani TaxID=5661 RepID=A0A504YBC7_LEIDO|nr:hypothetical protein CGC20_10020 [Leishmania donovani]CAJ1992278.1 hypothetical protein conserved [Leishmania donovani]VDZ48113.1 hypothetical_protein_conserved [Leishmania donovani]